MGILNKAQVDVLFQKESVLIGTTDVVPKFRVSAIFGEDAASFAQKMQNGGNGYGVGDYTLFYITHMGFLAAASFYNVRQLRDEEKMAEDI